jgi:hypothetical protein
LSIEWSFDLKEIINPAESAAGFTFELKNGRKLETLISNPAQRKALLDAVVQAQNHEEESKKKFIMLQDTPADKQ